MITLRFRNIWMVLAAASMLSLPACSQSDSDKSSSAASDEGGALAKKYRQKYGFGIYSSAVYPNDPAAPGPVENKDPNASYRASLPSAQQKEYDKALGAPEAAQDNGVSLAQEYASCLRKAGTTVGTTQPTSIGDTVKFQVSAQIPPDAQPLSKEEAMPKLTHEIDLALKDLQCGKNFRAAYWPKYKKNPFVGNVARQSPIALSPNNAQALTVLAPPDLSKARKGVQGDVNGLFLVLGSR